MTVKQVIGARYVPLFSEPIDWDNTKTYEPLTIVYYGGNSYTSKQAVPKGIDITNTDYWALTGNYNAQIEAYRKEVKQLDGRITANGTAIENETTRATAAESKNASDIAAEITRATAAESKNASDIAAEITRATGAENKNASDIAAETIRATAAEKVNANAITGLTNTFVPTTNPIYYGADPTGTKDSAKAINDCIAANKTTVFSPGTYKIETPIVTDYITDNRKSIDFNGAVITCDFPDFALKIGYLNYTDELAANNGSNANSNISFFKNGTINCTNAAGCGIKVMPHYMGPKFENLVVTANKYGFYAGDDSGTKSYPSDANIINCNFSAQTRSNTLENSVGITFKDTDETISNTRIYYYDICLDDKAGGKINNIHILGNRDINFTSGIAIRNNGMATLYENIFIDTYKTAIKATSDCTAVLINNLFDCAWTKITEHNVFDFSEASKYFTYNINNCYIDFNRQDNLKLLVPPRHVSWPQKLYGSKLTNVNFNGAVSGTHAPNPEFLYIDDGATIIDSKDNLYITSILMNSYATSNIEFTTGSNKFMLSIETTNKNEPPVINYRPIKINVATTVVFSYEYEWSEDTCLIKIFLKSRSSGFGAITNIKINRNKCIATAPFACGANLGDVTNPTIQEMGTVTCDMTI